MKKLKRIIVVLAIIVFAFVGLVIIFISPISKYIIEKYSEKYTNRKIKLSWAYVNPFTGYIHFQNLKIYEYKSNSVFISADGLSVNFAVLKFFSHGFEIESMELDHPVIKVIKDEKRLNFDDIIGKFRSKDTVQKKPSKTKVNLLNLKVTDAEIHYTDKQIPFDYFIKAGSFETKGKHWDEDTMSISYFFSSGPTKGTMKGEFHINFKTSDYLIADRISEFDLKPLEQYVKDLVNYGTLSASLDADLLAKGNFHDADNIIASGNLSIDDFHFGKTPDNDYMSFKKLNLEIKELSPVNRKYFFNNVSLQHPYFKYERYDNTDNIETMFAKKGAASSGAGGNDKKLNILVDIGRYIKKLSVDFFKSDYKVDNLAIMNGDLKYNDYSLSEEFSTGLQRLNIAADSINKHHSRVNLFVKSALQPYGNLALKLSIDPNDSSYFDLDFHIKNVAASMFNPYTITYTSYPLDRGSIELNSVSHVLGGAIKSENHLLIVDPRPTKRIRGKDKKWILVPLIFAFIRERGDVIDYEIPLTGDLKNPKFHFHDVVKHLLENIFVKPATTSYRFEVKNTEQAIEKSLAIKWPMIGSNLLSSQDKFLGETAEFLAKNKDAKIKIQPVEYTPKEKEYLIFFEAKKKFFLSVNHKDDASFSREDSITVYNLSLRDKNFMRYVNHLVKDSLLFTLQDKCTRIVGSKKINSLLMELDKKRIATFDDFFKKQQVSDRVKVQPKKTLVPFDGFSYFDIVYEGPIPEHLQKAYQKMNELDEEMPRKKYLKEHKKALLTSF